MPKSVFRPCIDLHNGQVKQIVGGSLSDKPSELKTNFVASSAVLLTINPPAFYAELYRKHNLTGAHVIKLGAGNDEAAKAALQAWPQGLQVGGGINESNAQEWLDAGASKVIVTSYLFPDKKFSLERLQSLSRAVGPERLVVDISCRRVKDSWVVAMNKWQDHTDLQVGQESINLISRYCSELLIHAADVEGLCQGIDQDLVRCLGQWVNIPCTYAGGAKALSDLELVDQLSDGKVDLTYGSSLDIFGGSQVKFDDLVKLSQR